MAGRDSGNLAEETKGNPLIPNVDPPGEIIRFKVLPALNSSHSVAKRQC